MAIVLLSLTIILFIIQKYYIESKTAATLPARQPGRAPSPKRGNNTACNYVFIDFSICNCHVCNG